MTSEYNLEKKKRKKKAGKEEDRQGGKERGREKERQGGNQGGRQGSEAYRKNREGAIVHILRSLHTRDFSFCY